MQKQVKPPRRCECCDSIVEHGEDDVVCNFCEKSINIDKPFIHITLHNGRNGTDTHAVEFDSVICFFNWMISEFPKWSKKQMTANSRISIWNLDKKTGDEISKIMKNQFPFPVR